MWHLARKTTQTFVFLLILITPLLAFYDVFQHSKSIYGDSLAARRIAQMDKPRQLLIEVGDAIFGARSRNAAPLTEYLAGTPWALRIGRYTAIEPLNALGALAAGGGEWKIVLLAVLPLLLLTVVLGRVFCGWLCPVHYLLEMTDSLRSLLVRWGMPVRNIRLKRTMKFVILGLGTLSTAMIGAQIFSIFYTPAILGRQIYELIYFGAMSGGALIILSIMLGEVFLSRRFWCRYLCPGGGLYSLLGYFRVLSIKRTPSLCDSCGDCNKTCAFGLSPMTDITGMECTSCLECVRVCPTEALAIRLISPGDLRHGPEETSEYVEAKAS